MIKSQLIASLAVTMTDLSEKQVNDAVNSILELMCTALENNQRIEIRGFGSFALRYCAPRQAHNPKTGQLVTSEAKYRARFKPGKAMRTRINDARNNNICTEG